MNIALSLASKEAVYMAVDSVVASDRHLDCSGCKGAQGISYFKSSNIGISTWGFEEIENEPVHEWLKKALDDFRRISESSIFLEELTDYLAKRLSQAFGLNSMTRNESFYGGLHISGYSPLSREFLPGLSHLQIKPNSCHSAVQKACLALPSDAICMHLRNGLYQELDMLFDDFGEIDRIVLNQISSRYRNGRRPPKDLVEHNAEWLGSWISQLRLLIEGVGLPCQIGRSVDILAFDKKKEVRWFHLPELHEIVEFSHE